MPGTTAISSPRESWQGHDGKTVDENWKNKYLPLEDVLYKHDIYMMNPPKVVKKFSR